MRRFLFGALFAVPALAAASNLAACSGSSAATVTCGPGTELDAGVCYVTSPSETDAGGADTSAPSGNDSGGATGPADTGTGTVADTGPTGPAAPTFAGVTSVGPASSTSLQVTWGPATDPTTAASALVYDVYVGTTKGGENFSAPTLTSPPGAASALVDGLVTGTTYYVVVRAKNAAKLEDKNVVEISGVPATDTAAPTFSGATSAAPAPQDGVKLTWSAGIDDKTPTAGLGYFIYAATAAGGETYNVPSFATDPGVTSFTVPALPQPTATYYFVVRAHDAAGNLDTNTVEVSSKPGPDTIAPAFGGCTSAVTMTSTQVTVSWDQATDNTSPQAQIAYDVFTATKPGAEDFTTPAATFTGTSLGLVTQLKSATTYYFVCRARDLSNNEDTNTAERTAATPVDTTPPTFAGATSVTNVTATGAQINWTAATDPQTPSSAIVYDVFQATSPGGEVFTATPQATSPAGATSITLVNLSPSSTFYWVVRARDEAGNEDTNTNEVNAVTGVSFAENVQPIFSTHCAVVGCHVPGNPPEGQVLAAGFAYSNIVNVQAQESTKLRVAPGNLANSYLYDKITAQQSSGEYMPPPTTSDVLTSAEKNTIMNWISQGAANN